MYPKSLGQGGRRSLSDVQVGRIEESPGKDTRPPTRTVSLAAPGAGPYLPLGERAPVGFQQRRISATRPIPRVETSDIDGSERTDLRQEYESQRNKPSGTVKSPEEGVEAQMDLSIERRKENLAPVVNQQSRTEFATSTAKEADIANEEPQTRLPTPSPSSSRATVRIARDSIETSRSISDDSNGPTTSSGPPRQDPQSSLQSLYGNIPPGWTSNLELIHAIEDPFDANYTAAFDVFYNTRRFFDKPSGTILDGSYDNYPIGSGTVSGKSIYGVFINDSLIGESIAAVGTRSFIPPSLPGSAGANQKLSGPQKSLTVPNRRLRRPQLSDSMGYNSLPRRRKVAGRDTITSPIRLRPIFRTSPPRAPSFGMRKRASTLRPKAVMAWWKEREAMISQVAPTGRGTIDTGLGMQMSKLIPNEKLKAPPSPKDGPPKKKEKEKRRNPLRRLSSLFRKRQNSETSLKSMAKSNESHRSLNSLPSQVSLPQYRQGLPSFITANIVRNNRASHAASGNIEIARPRQISDSSSVVQQRISSFEAPRPIRVEKKYQTSPSYQLLNTLKPVRGRSLKEHFERGPEPGTRDVNPNALCEDIRAQKATPQHELVTPPDISGREIPISSHHTPPILDTPNDSDSIHLEDFSVTNPPFIENFEGETSSSQEIYDAELVLSSPDFSDPQIVTSTPLQNSGLGSPLVPQSISILGDSRSSHNFDSSLDSSANSNRHNNSMNFRPIGATKSTSSSKLAHVRKTVEPIDKRYDSTRSVDSAASDDNKENIAPNDSAPDLPNLSPRNSRRRSLSGILGFIRGETNTQGMGVKLEGSLRRHNRGWQKRPLRMVKSALGPFGAKNSGKTISQDQHGIKKKRQSVLDLFKFSRPADTAHSTPTPGTPSFRVLPTTDSISLSSEIELPVHKNRSRLSMKLGRKKKPILVVPKYTKKDRSRGNLFGLFEFKKGSPRSSFVIHSDSKEASERKFSTGSNGTISKATRRLSKNVFPIFKRRTFSAPPDTQSLLPQPELLVRERSISPPPQLELFLPSPGL
ncbi:hypothetical protein TWF788_008703 [Orbilia oligospora]|uniref:Uncharacterized protein n=1 Tax=Orbilia oligospora TaxID=2813651 RepID=A0A7C8PDW2_ORBOL|nr:hypothetical protein TWF788_008703 [Orbilia oligospora]